MVTAGSSLRTDIGESEFLSSDAGQSVIDVLRLLDGPQSPDIHFSIPTRDKSQGDQLRKSVGDMSGKDSKEIGVAGQRLKVDARPQQQPLPSRLLSSGKGASKAPQQIGKKQQRPKIRNYNIRDDHGVR